jgi:hypothetical protein
MARVFIRRCSRFERAVRYRPEADCSLQFELVLTASANYPTVQSVAENNKKSESLESFMYS